MKHERTAIHESNHLKRFEDYLLARGRKSAGRYLQVVQRFLEANPGELEPFEAQHVNRFLANLSRGGAGGEVPFVIWRMPPAGENHRAQWIELPSAGYSFNTRPSFSRDQERFTVDRGKIRSARRDTREIGRTLCEPSHILSSRKEERFFSSTSSTCPHSSSRSGPASYTPSP